MRYQVPSTDPNPPTRTAALVGVISALGIVLSPFLAWWQLLLGQGLSIGGQPAPQFFQYHYGTRIAFGRLLVFFGLICVGLWVQYARNTRRWMRPHVAQLLILLYLTLSIGIAVVAGYAIAKHRGLPGLEQRHQIGIGLYMLFGASLAQVGCLIWLVRERASWAAMQQLKERP